MGIVHTITSIPFYQIALEYVPSFYFILFVCLFIYFFADIPAFVIAGNRNPIPDDCPLELTYLINSCWASEPDKRYETLFIIFY